MCHVCFMFGRIKKTFQYNGIEVLCAIYLNFPCSIFFFNLEKRELVM